MFSPTYLSGDSDGIAANTSNTPSSPTSSSGRDKIVATRAHAGKSQPKAKFQRQRHKVGGSKGKRTDVKPSKLVSLELKVYVFLVVCCHSITVV